MFARSTSVLYIEYIQYCIAIFVYVSSCTVLSYCTTYSLQRVWHKCSIVGALQYVVQLQKVHVHGSSRKTHGSILYGSTEVRKYFRSPKYFRTSVALRKYFRTKVRKYVVLPYLRKVWKNGGLGVGFRVSGGILERPFLDQNITKMTEVGVGGDA